MGHHKKKRNELIFIFFLNDFNFNSHLDKSNMTSTSRNMDRTFCDKYA